MKQNDISLDKGGCPSCNTDHHSNDEESKIPKKEIIRLSIGAALLMFIIILDLGGWNRQDTAPLFMISFSLSLFTLLLTGGPVLLQALKNVTRGKVFDEFFLMSVATIGAFAIGEASEGIAVMLFYQVGELMQGYAVSGSRKSISSLMDIRPDSASILADGKIITVNPENLDVGQIFMVSPGEKIPLDGIVVEGRSTLDMSSLTGESLPKDVNVGDEVLSGSINRESLLTIRATKRYEQSTVSKILDLVENAAAKKAPMENFISKFASYYTPAVVGLALLIALLPPLLTNGLFREWVHRGLIFLVISCPCALVISIPLSFFGGIGLASRHGILIKGGNYLEALANVDTVAFDKTGTLTKGIFTVSKVFISSDIQITEKELAEYAAYAEAYSNHPIAKSIIEHYDMNMDLSRIDSHTILPGLGIRSKIDGLNIIAGNEKLMSREEIAIPNIEELGTKVYVAIDRLYAGCFVINDELKDDSATAITQLKNLGVNRTVMLTGDAESVAATVAASLKLDEYYSGLLPDQKVARLESLYDKLSTKGRLVFVGDGINDAPVLARSDVGVAMGALGSDAAIEAADIVIMTDEPSKLATALKISKRTRRTVWQNIIFALIIKILLLLLGAFGLATMWEAVFADVGVALLAILNSLGLLKSQV